MVYDGEFAIVNRSHDIPETPPISNGEITAGGHIITVAFDFFDRLIEIFIFFRFTKNIKRLDHHLDYDGDFTIVNW